MVAGRCSDVIQGDVGISAVTWLLLEVHRALAVGSVHRSFSMQEVQCQGSLFPILGPIVTLAPTWDCNSGCGLKMHPSDRLGPGSLFGLSSNLGLNAIPRWSWEFLNHLSQELGATTASVLTSHHYIPK